jgi:ABC-2 type transport system ATP-binding protein
MNAATDRNPGKPALGRRTAPNSDGPAHGWGVRDLVVRYGHRVALDGVDLDVPAGSVTAVVGADGAGKSSLLRALAGAVRAEAGEVWRPGRRKLGYVASDRAVYRDLTTIENLTFAGEAYGLTGAALQEKMRVTLARIGLVGAERRLAARLSGGMRQKLALAMALLHDPSLLILDEPTTGIDPLSRVELWELIAATAARGTAVALATTYLDEAERAARVLVLEDGRQLAAGAPDEIVAAMPGSIYECDRALPGQAWRRGSSWRVWVDGDGAPPASATRVAPDLEDALLVAELGRSGTGSSVGEANAPANAASPALAAPAAPVKAPATAVGPLLRASGVGQRFGALQVLDAVDLEIERGEVVGLIGANGAGKTTLLRIALGLLRPTTGEAQLLGEEPRSETRRRIGYMPQGLGLYEDLTVGENLAFVARTFGVAPPPLEPELEAARGRLVGELPLGLRRRVAFAATLSHRPELLVLDEPTSGVGVLGRIRLWELIRSAADAGAGVLVTTHYMGEASQCDRLVVLLAGQVAARGTASEIADDLMTVEVFVEPWDRAFEALQAAGFPVALAGRRIRIPGADAAAVGRALDAAGLHADLKSSPATFEEAFVLLARRSGADR